MNDPDEKQFKAEIDEIMKRVEIVLKRIENLDSKAKETSSEGGE